VTPPAATDSATAPAAPAAPIPALLVLEDGGANPTQGTESAVAIARSAVVGGGAVSEER
jgi:hypothetical protein